MNSTTKRFGTFSSSNIWKLMTKDRKGIGWGAPALKYMKQVQHELNLGRSINPERDSRATSWGRFVEKRAFDVLSLKYKLVSTDKRYVHPETPLWTGLPDLLAEETIGDVKCPFSLEVFCDKIDSLAAIEVYKEEFPEDYYQLVSNAILTGSKYAEAVIYVPYQEELATIREMASNFDGNQNSIAWLNWAEDDELPYLIKGGRYKNINIFRFEVPEIDKKNLSDTVLRAIELLDIPKKIEAER